MSSVFPISFDILYPVSRGVEFVIDTVRIRCFHCWWF